MKWIYYFDHGSNLWLQRFQLGIAQWGRSVDHAWFLQNLWDEGSRYDSRSFGCADQLWLLFYWMPWRWRCEAADTFSFIISIGRAMLCFWFYHLYVTLFAADLFMEGRTSIWLFRFYTNIADKEQQVWCVRQRMGILWRWNDHFHLVLQRTWSA